MIEIGNKRFRNLQEQVAWLTLMINRATDIVKNVAGVEPDVASLAPASTYSNGTTFAIGTAAPYEYYVALNGNWVGLGTIPLAGPAGSNGDDGYSIFITSQTTDSSTSFILGTSIYDPLGRTYTTGDLILSEQGDIFAVTAAAAAGATVIWRCNIMGPTGPQGGTGSQGIRGTRWFEGTDIAYSSGSYSWASSDWPAGVNPMPGDLYLVPSEYTSGGETIPEGAVFAVTNVIVAGASMGYLFTLKGDKGSVCYNGTDLAYDTLGAQVEVLLSDAPMRIYDYYMVTTDYQSDGYDFYEGDIYICSSVGATTADLDYVCNLRGPTGATGATGASGSMFYVGGDAYCSAPADPGDPQTYRLADADVPSGMKSGDYYISNATYTSGGVNIYNGDVYKAYSVLTGIGAFMYKETNIAGPGMPAVTVADAGKFAVVNSSGQWAAITMTEWSGGSY